MQAVKGAYIVEDCAGTPDVILLASGSEVATLIDGAEKLKADGVKVRVVSVPSEGLFRDQSKEYQKSVLPCGVPKFGLTSGLPVTLAGLVALRRRSVRSRSLRIFRSCERPGQGVRLLGRERLQPGESDAEKIRRLFHKQGREAGFRKDPVSLFSADGRRTAYGKTTRMANQAIPIRFPNLS